MNVIWNYMRYLPCVMIVWHIFLLVTQFPLMASFGIFIVEGCWVLLYGIAWKILLRPSPVGYGFLTVFLTLNIGWEIWISGLMLNDARLFAFLIPSLLLIFLFLNRDRFNISAPYTYIALVLFGALLSEAAYVIVANYQYKTTTEVRRWSVHVTGHEALPRSGVKWCGANALTARFPESPPENLGHQFVLGRLDLRTGKLVVIDKNGYGPACSDDGQWLSFARKQETTEKIDIREYLRYHVPSGNVEVVLKYVNRGVPFDSFMAPSGDKLIFLNHPNDTLQVLSVKEPRWPVYQWDRPKDLGHFMGKWMPDGKTILVKKSGDLFMTISTTDGKIVQKIPLPADYEESPYFSDDFKVSPDGSYIYRQLSRGRKLLYYYCLNEPESGWRPVGTRVVANYAVGPEGMLVYNAFPRDIGYYSYWFGGKLANNGLWLFKPKTGETIRLTAGYDEEPSISPDGKTIAFFRGIDNKIISSGASRYDLMLLKQQ